MSHAFDPGYAQPPFDALCRDYPGADIYPPEDFRIEWGPIFHRGRLDGSARVLVIGQDPGAHECIARRILVGEAGQRVQGFLARLGITESYVMLNAFVYPVYGQAGGNRHIDDAAIAAYRNRWLDAVLAGSPVEAVVTFGRLADLAWQQWRQTPAGAASSVVSQALRHPTYPESSSKGNAQKLAAAMRAMLEQWNAGLEQLAATGRDEEEDAPERRAEVDDHAQQVRQLVDVGPGDGGVDLQPEAGVADLPGSLQGRVEDTRDAPEGVVGVRPGAVEGEGQGTGPGIVQLRENLSGQPRRD